MSPSILDPAEPTEALRGRTSGRVPWVAAGPPT